MPRQKSGPYRKQRIKRILRRAKGFRGGRGNLQRQAREAVMRAGKYAPELWKDATGKTVEDLGREWQKSLAK